MYYAGNFNIYDDKQNAHKKQNSMLRLAGRGQLKRLKSATKG